MAAATAIGEDRPEVGRKAGDPRYSDNSDGSKKKEASVV
jgi:hypothetical protein